MLAELGAAGHERNAGQKLGAPALQLPVQAGPVQLRACGDR